MTIELLPCPHCGSPASIHTMPNDGNCNDGGQFVMCDNSRCMAASTLVFPLMDSAEPLLAERWNRREPAATPVVPPSNPLESFPYTLNDLRQAAEADATGWMRVMINSIAMWLKPALAASPSPRTPEQPEQPSVNTVESDGTRPAAVDDGRDTRASAWVRVDDRMPGLGPNCYVLAHYENKHSGRPVIVRAYFAPRHTIECNGESDEFADYSEEDDCYYVPEGWYECNQHEETNWLIDEVVTHWMPLPTAPNAPAQPVISGSGVTEAST